MLKYTQRSGLFLLDRNIGRQLRLIIIRTPRLCPTLRTSSRCRHRQRTRIRRLGNTPRIRRPQRNDRLLRAVLFSPPAISTLQWYHDIISLSRPARIRSSQRDHGILIAIPGRDPFKYSDHIVVLIISVFFKYSRRIRPSIKFSIPNAAVEPLQTISQCFMLHHCHNKQALSLAAGS